MCPGSRCAPLTLAFVRQHGLNVKTFSDERSAGFIALGIAQQTNMPAVLLCTSGTAAYNFSPAIAEAFFNRVPMIIFTADRPREWIGQQDGQTIFQPAIYGRHVKRSFELPQTYDHADDLWSINRTVNEAINLSIEEPRGPVHINSPFREPLYPGQDDIADPVPSGQVTDIVAHAAEIPGHEQETLINNWDQFHNILIVAGQNEFDDSLTQRIEAFSIHQSVPVVSDIIGNLHGAPTCIRHADAFLGEASDDLKKSLQPDLLITFGRSLVSKNLKLFLRRFPAKAQWHIQQAGDVADTFQQLKKIIRTTPASFFDLIAARLRQETFEGQKQRNFYKLWEIEERRTQASIETFFPQASLGEFELVFEMLRALPKVCNLHLANSLSVRYANFVGLSPEQGTVKVYANRGTSGIDGCTSTAVGHALSSNEMNILITGDVAFFYDRNAFWHNYDLPNLRIILLNNHGGAIFKIIDGEGLPESDEFFVTNQKLNAQKVCEEFGFEYIRLDNKRKLNNSLKNFLDSDPTVKILELESSPLAVKSIIDNFKVHLKKRYEL
jgi:2-succinyl-5-enolpyruvyl-6-hydroxy-3-cyclohexene-1-carboxylate synthase